MNIFKILYYLLKHGKMPDTTKWWIKEDNKVRYVQGYVAPNNFTIVTSTTNAEVFTGEANVQAKVDAINAIGGPTYDKKPKP